MNSQKLIYFGTILITEIMYSLILAVKILYLILEIFKNYPTEYSCYLSGKKPIAIWKLRYILIEYKTSIQ